MQNFKLEVGSTFFVKNGNRGKILYKLPEDVTDDFPFIGYIQEDSGHKAGMAWNAAGENSEGVQADFIDRDYDFNAELGQWVKNHNNTILTCLRLMDGGGHGKAIQALKEYDKIHKFFAG